MGEAAGQPHPGPVRRAGRAGADDPRTDGVAVHPPAAYLGSGPDRGRAYRGRGRRPGPGAGAWHRRRARSDRQGHQEAGAGMNSSTLASLSNLLIPTATVVYAIALLAHTVEWAAGLRVPRKAEEKVLVGAGGPPVEAEVAET